MVNRRNVARVDGQRFVVAVFAILFQELLFPGLGVVNVVVVHVVKGCGIGFDGDVLPAPFYHWSRDDHVQEVCTIHELDEHFELVVESDFILIILGERQR